MARPKLMTLILAELAQNMKSSFSFKAYKQLKDAKMHLLA
jgi:hypothetical protein